mgnify:CR=1 FL=1
MGILRADRITGLGGANAITGSTHFTGSNNIGNFLRIDTGATEDFTFGTGDFTIEFWVFSEGTGFQRHFYDGRGTTNASRLLIYMDANNSIFYYGNDGTRITSSSALPNNEWVHFALVRASGSTKMYFNGTQTGSTYSDSIDYVAPAQGWAFIGSNGGTNGIEPTGGGYFNGFLSNYRIVKGTGVYTSNFTPPNTRLTAIDGTVLLTCTSSGNVSETEGGNDVLPTAKDASTPPQASHFTPNSPVGFSTTTDVGSQYGSTFDGFGNFATSTYMVPPGGNSRERNRGRGLIMGGATGSPSTNTDIIKYFDVASQGITETFGNLTDPDGNGRRSLASVSSSTRACTGGGYSHGGSPGTVKNIIDFVTIANTGNATDFGDMQNTAYGYGAASNQTRGLFAGGYQPNNSAVVNTIDLITIATTGNASNFGDLTVIRRALGGLESTTRGVFFGGTFPAVHDEIDFVTFSTTGDATDFGDLTDERDNIKGSSSSTRGVMAGGRDPSNTNIIDFITIASAGNALDFGDLISAKFYFGATSNKTRAVWAGDNSLTNAMEFVTIATTGNAVDFGDQNGTAQQYNGCASDSHGGL